MYILISVLCYNYSAINFLYLSFLSLEIQMQQTETQ